LDLDDGTAKKVTLLMEGLFSFIISRLGLRQENPRVHFAALANPEGRKVLLTRDQLTAIRTAGMACQRQKRLRAYR